MTYFYYFSYGQVRRLASIWMFCGQSTPDTFRAAMDDGMWADCEHREEIILRRLDLLESEPFSEWVQDIVENGKPEDFGPPSAEITRDFREKTKNQVGGWAPVGIDCIGEPPDMSQPMYLTEESVKMLLTDF